MGLLDLFKRPDINQGVREYSSVPGALRRMGYANITNIGGIAAWKGTVER